MEFTQCPELSFDFQQTMTRKHKALVIGTKVGPSATAGVISQFLKPIIKQVQKVDLEK